MKKLFAGFLIAASLLTGAAAMAAATTAPTNQTQQPSGIQGSVGYQEFAPFNGMPMTQTFNGQAPYGMMYRGGFRENGYGHEGAGILFGLAGVITLGLVWAFLILAIIELCHIMKKRKNEEKKSQAN
jgi:hypothetical protein